MKEKILVYQMFPRLFGNTNEHPKKNGDITENGCGKFDSITLEALSSLKEFGFSHLWYTGVLEHATMTDYTDYGIAKDYPQIIKGRAGSPYAVKDYYDVDPDLANDVNKRLHEYRALIKRTHEQGLKVIMDFIPNHLARNYVSDAKPSAVTDFGFDDDKSKAFAPNNNFYYIPDKKLQISADIQKRYAQLIQESDSYVESPAKATGNDVFTNEPSIHDWYETVKLNYGVNHQDGTKHFDPIPNTWFKMKDVLLYWAAFGVDAFRCDMAEMVPVEFWKWVIKEIKSEYPDLVFIAEIYNPKLYEAFIVDAGFDFLYDKVGLYDSLRNIMEGHGSAKEISESWKRLNNLDDQMLRFLENHDEQRIASDFFAKSALSAIPFMLISVTMNNGPAMLYQGQEFGEKGMDEEGFSGKDGRTTIFDYWSLACLQRWNNNGNFNDEALLRDERKLKELYKKIFTLSKNNSAFYDGKLYDLMWVNQDYQYINPDNIFAYLRYNDEQAFLIVCNLRNERCDFRLKIPHHAFDLMGIASISDLHGKDVFCSNTSFSESVGKVFHEGIPLSMEPYDAFVFRLKSQQSKYDFEE